MIRVLHIVGRMDRGGVETFLMNVYRKIDRTAIQFDFIVHTNDKCSYDDEILQLGGKIYQLPYMMKEPVNRFMMIKNIVKENKYSIVHRHADNAAVYFDLLAAKFGGARELIAHSHSSQTHNSAYSLILRPLLNMIVSSRFACSDEAGKWLFGNKEFKVIKNAIDTDRFCFNQEIRNLVRTSFGFDNETVIGNVARLELVKNQAFLIKVFAEYVKIENNAKLLLVGGGSLEKEMKKLVLDLNLNDNVLFLGSRSDVNELMQAMDVLVLSSVFEGFPVSLVEAQAAALPCIVSDRISISTDITNSMLFLPLEKGPEFWAHQIYSRLTIFERKDTKELICNSGFDINKVTDFLTEFYKSKVKK